MIEPLAPELLDLMTPGELAEYERILLAELADVDDGPALIGDIDLDNPPDTPGALAAALTRGREVQRPHLDLIDEVLLRAEAEGRQRIILNVGPRYGKTRRIRWACAHRLMRRPETRIIYGSYGKALAHEQTRWVRDQLEAHDLGVRVRQDTRAADRWYLDGYDGGMLAAGIGSGITGFGADLLVVDDVIADDRQAQSATWREAGWRWFTQTAFDRLEPDASVVIVMTRWHADDLAGRLLTLQPGVWTHIRVPTVAEDDDPLGRTPGELLWPERYDAAAVAEQRATLTEHGFAARHQQRPAAAEGGLFKREHLRRTWQQAGPAYLDVGGQRVAVDDCWRFLTVDLAASTRTSADYTVAAAWALTPFGDLLLLDGRRERVEAAGHWPLVDGLRGKWAADVVFVESRMFGTTMVYEAGRANVPVAELHADVDKYTRALPAAARAETGRLWLPDPAGAPWLRDWVDELVAFPNAAHDDVVDVLAYAARVALTHYVPRGVTPIHAAPLVDEIDLMTVPL
ncbi:MAG TPA: phage terminase large subunit [Amycolatopsis sp.]|nr:phage terminase large subunit [Amycolatopsis sp.]